METQDGRKRKKINHNIESVVWFLMAVFISLSSIMVGCIIFLLILSLLNVI